MSPADYAAAFLGDLHAADADRPRSNQSQRGALGVSDVGVCRERARRKIMGSPRSTMLTPMSAMVGTWVDAGVRAARKASNPALIVDAEFHVKLPSGEVLPGHPDEIDPTEPSICDVKTVDGLSAVRRSGPDEQQQFQRHLYALGALQNGLVHDAESLIVRNVWVDRSGRHNDVHVQQEPFDEGQVQRASEWLADVTYACDNGEEASKDKPAQWCFACCEYAGSCRRDYLGGAELTDPTLVGAVLAYEEARTLGKELELVKEDAARMLRGVDGTVGDLSVRSTHVNGTESRGSYERLDVRRVKP